MKILFYFLLLLFVGCDNNQSKQQTITQIKDNNHLYAVELIKQLEGYANKPYNAYEGGFAKYVCYGNRVDEYKSMYNTYNITKENCDDMINRKVDEYEQIMLKDNLILENANQHGAVLSLIYNIKNNYSAFKKTRLHKYLQYNPSNKKAIIKEWMEFGKVNNNYDDALLARRVNELINFIYNDENEPELKKIIVEEAKKHSQTLKIEFVEVIDN